MSSCHSQLDDQYRESNKNSRDYQIGQSTRTAFAILVMFFKIHVGKNVFFDIFRRLGSQDWLSHRFQHPRPAQVHYPKKSFLFVHNIFVFVIIVIAMIVSMNIGNSNF